MLVSPISCILAGFTRYAVSIDDLLRRAVENKASDLHLKVGNHPYLRVDGLLAPVTDVPRITPEEMLSMAFSMMTNRQKQKFKETAELDMAYGVAAWGASASTSSSSAATSAWCSASFHKNPHHGRIEPTAGHFKNLRRAARPGARHGDHRFR